MQLPHADDAAPIAVFDYHALRPLRHRRRQAATVTAQGHVWPGPVVPVFACHALQTLQTRPVSTALAGVPAASASVLVVDDDADIRTLVQTVLVDEGYEVLVAPDGKQALEVVQARQPKVVLLDMNMPVMDGPSFCQALGERHLRARPAIVVMTASNEAPAFRAHCAAADTLGKPFALDELCAVVGRHTA